MQAKIYLLLGTNLGDRLENLAKVSQEIHESIGKIIVKSSIYVSAAWGKTNQPDFLNQVLCLDTTLSPTELLVQTQAIEKTLGRIKKEHWGERIIDIDILYFSDLVYEQKYLKIPHPFIQERRFTLVPLAEIAPNFQHPILKKTNNELLENCEDTLGVWRFFL